jgi:hypothetical protein
MTTNTRADELLSEAAPFLARALDRIERICDPQLGPRDGTALADACLRIVQEERRNAVAESTGGCTCGEAYGTRPVGRSKCRYCTHGS